MLRLITATLVTISYVSSFKLDVADPFEVPTNLTEIASIFNEFVEENIPDALIRARAIPGLRIGTVAVRDISPGELYCRIPNRVVLDATRISSSPDLSRLVSLLDGTPARRNPITDLLLTFLYERFELGPTSFWWPYFISIPAPHDLDAPALWPADDVAAALHAFPAMRASIRHTATDYNASYNTLLSSIAANEARDRTAAARLRALVTHARYVYAHAVLDSRSIWWSPGGRHLVPLLDLINCRAHGRPHFTRQSADGTAADTYATARYARGEEVYENYGQPSSTYLQYHGFALAANIHDCIAIPLPFAADMSPTAPPPRPRDRLRLARAGGHGGVQAPKGAPSGGGTDERLPRLCVGFPSSTPRWAAVGGARGAVDARDVSTWPSDAVAHFTRAYEADCAASGRPADWHGEGRVAATRYVLRYVAALVDALAATAAADLDTLAAAGAPSGPADAARGPKTPPPPYVQPARGALARARAGVSDCAGRGAWCGYPSNCGSDAGAAGVPAAVASTIPPYPRTRASASEYATALAHVPDGRAVGVAAFRSSQRHVAAAVLRRGRGAALVACVAAEAAAARAARVRALHAWAADVSLSVAADAAAIASVHPTDAASLQPHESVGAADSRRWSAHDAAAAAAAYAAAAADAWEAAVGVLEGQAASLRTQYEAAVGGLVASAGGSNGEARGARQAPAARAVTDEL